MQRRDLTDDRIVEQPTFDGGDDALDVFFSLQKPDRVRESDVHDDVECVPVQPCPKVDVLTFKSVEFTLEDDGAFICERFEVEKGTQCKCGSHGSLEVPVPLGFDDGEYSRDAAVWGFGVEESIEIALRGEHLVTWQS